LDQNRPFNPTQVGLFQDIEHTTDLGYVTILTGIQDPVGQSIILIDPSKQDFSRVSCMNIIKAVWYCIHATLEQESTQKNGVIALTCPRNAKLSQHNSKFDCLLHGTVQGILTIRISCIALCHALFLHILWPLIRLALSKCLQKRIQVLGGKDKVVLREFQAMGLSKDKVPELIGGDLRVDHRAWFEAWRRAGK
jgi:hypothetical protein